MPFFVLVLCLVGFLATSGFAIQIGGDNETVIIVGTGWSGIGAAVELRKAGKPFVLLEARIALVAVRSRQTFLVEILSLIWDHRGYMARKITQ